MSALSDKLKKNSKIKDTASLRKSIFYKNKDIVPTEVLMANVALGGSIDSGLTSGLTILAGKSKHFKTSFALMMASAYLKQYKDAVILFYDSEFGSPQSYFESFDIDIDRVIHTPIKTIEELKFDIIAQLEGLDRLDKVIIIIDSLGNIASKKELEDAINEKSVADMTRAKALKGLFRMVTPYLTIKDIPLIGINHIYMTQEMFSKAVVSGGCLHAGTKIQIADNTLKDIEKIKSGEMVKTKDGSKEVTASWNPLTLLNGFPECYEIEFEDGYKVICSAAHEFLVNDKWVEAKDLSIDMNCETISEAIK